MQKRSIVAMMMVLALVALFVGCASKEKKPEAPAKAISAEYDGAPKWVIQSCNAYWGEKASGKICGVGSAGSTRNIGMARSAAMGRGRTEIARTLDVKVKSMLKDYQSTTTGGEEYGNAANDEQHVVDVSKQITDMSLSGTEMVDSWLNTKTGTLYVLMVLDVEKFKNAVSDMKQLSEKTRQAVVERAEKAFDELDQATTK